MVPKIGTISISIANTTNIKHPRETEPYWAQGARLSSATSQGSHGINRLLATQQRIPDSNTRYGKNGVTVDIKLVNEGPCSYFKHLRLSLHTIRVFKADL